MLLAALAALWPWSPLALPAYADAPSFDEPLPFGPGSDRTFSVAVGDMDGDGALDIVVGNNEGQNAVYLNDGAGGFPLGTARFFGAGSDGTFSVAVGDVDGDGDLDLVVGNGGSSGRQNAVYLNDGAGGFPLGTACPFGTGLDDTRSVAVGDVDGDGALDIVVGNYLQQNAVYLNDGAGSFPTTRPFGGSGRSVALGDVNGDGALDIVGQNAVYLNDGAGSFPTARPFGGSGQGVALGDVDGDGALDIAVGNWYAQNVVYLNDGAGNFPLGTARTFGTGSDYTSSVAMGDVDGDGTLDIVVGNLWQNAIYLNDGDGYFPTGTAHPFGSSSDPTQSIALGDVNGNGALDIVVGNDSGQNVIYLNNGAGGFPLRAARFFGTDLDWTLSMAVSDVNGDGALDLVAGNEVQNAVYLNDGAGNFPLETARPFGTGSDYTISVAVGDVNGDGALDLAVGNSGQNAVYLNDGAGGFPLGAARPFGTDLDMTLSVAVGDMNGDGALDLVVGNYEQQNAVYLNDGVGNFPLETARPFGTGSDQTWSVAVGDVDGDGALDLVAGNEVQNAVYLNDGAGNFPLETARPFGTGSDYTISVAVGDVNGDGAPDLIVGNYIGLNVIYVNDGAGGFPLETARNFGIGPDPTASVAVGDVNGDGALDIVVGNANGQNAAYLNDGAGNFSAARSFGTGSDCTYGIAVGDLDGDGVLDLVAGDYNEMNVVYLNRSRWPKGLADNPPSLAVTRPVTTANADFFSSPVLLDDPTIPITYTLYDPEGDPVGRVAAFYSPDGGGRWLPAVATSGTVTQHLATGRQVPVARAYNPSLAIPDGTGSPLTVTLAITKALDIADVDVWMTIGHTQTADLAAVLVSPGGTAISLYSSGTLSGSYLSGTVFDDEAMTSILSGTAPYTGTYRPIGSLSVLDGETMSGTWTLWITDTQATGIGGTLTAWGLRIRTPAVTHVYTWDVASSGFFGQSDNVVLRLVAYPQPAQTAITGTYRYTDRVPGPFQHPYASATTFPFRVRGTQVRAYSETVHISNTVENAMVYRLPAGQLGGAEPMGGVERPFRTDHRGYLQGRGEVTLGDELFAMLPVHTALNYAGSMELDGTDDHITTSLNVDQSGISPGVTMMAWVYPASTGPERQYAIGSDDGGFDWSILHQGGTWYVATGEGERSTGLSVDLEQWQHVAAAFDPGAGAVRFYKNGQEVLIPYLDYDTSDGNIEIGCGPGPGACLHGEIDAVSIWDVVRTQDEIRADMIRPLDGDEAGLIAYWPFDDPGIATTGIVADRSANGHDGTVHGATWSGESLGGYTVYHTSGVPSQDGLDAFTVSEPGVQEITVTAQYPLILFDLNVSLEWDAREDTLFLDQLESDVRRASELLYDWTNGQAALGRVTIYHDKQHWADAHVQVYASNRLRPNADQGGVVTAIYTDTDWPDVQYASGQVRIGAEWNRYGETSGTLGEDWPRTLAHELGHYLFFLDDNYLGLDDDGTLISVYGCPGAMTDPYRDDASAGYGEFHPDWAWTAACTQTLSHQLTGRSDWATMDAFYDWLQAPGPTTPITDASMQGPHILPLAVTQVVVDPYPDQAISPTIAVPIFFLTGGGERYVQGGRARAFLFRGDRLTDLGGPTADQVYAHGVRSDAGDVVCVYDVANAHQGCAEAGTTAGEIEMLHLPAWQPDVRVTEVTTETIGVGVDVESAIPLKARFYRVEDAASEVITLTHSGDEYVGAFSFVSETLPLEGYILAWADADGDDVPDTTEAQVLTDYTLGGNPGLMWARGGLMWARGGLMWARGGLMWARGGLMWARGGLMWARGAPGMSADGRAIVFGEGITFEEGELFALQSVSHLPDAPTWATAIGQGYRLVVSEHATGALDGASLGIHYLGSQVPPGEERWLGMYHWDESLGEWALLETELDVDHNMATARVGGEGLYALMSSIEVPLYAAGWNLVSYPVYGTRSVTEALGSIDDHYAIVYGYDEQDLNDPWKVYAKGVPGYVDDLHVLAFSRCYWISATEPVTWYLRGSSGDDLSAVSTFGSPPATYYGTVQAGNSFTPAAGMQVTAWIDNHACGQGETLEVDGEIVYSVNVFAGGPGDPSGCGQLGRMVTFYVGGQLMKPTAAWNDSRLWKLALAPDEERRLYLPVILRNQ